MTTHVRSYIIKPVYNGHSKNGFCRQVAFVGASETTYPIFTGQIKTGLSGQETANCR